MNDVVQFIFAISMALICAATAAATVWILMTLFGASQETALVTAFLSMYPFCFIGGIGAAAWLLGDLKFTRH